MPSVCLAFLNAAHSKHCYLPTSLSLSLPAATLLYTLSLCAAFQFMANWERLSLSTGRVYAPKQTAQTQSNNNQTKCFARVTTLTNTHTHWQANTHARCVPIHTHFLAQLYFDYARFGTPHSLDISTHNNATSWTRIRTHSCNTLCPLTHSSPFLCLGRQQSHGLSQDSPWPCPCSHVSSSPPPSRLSFSHQPHW